MILSRDMLPILLVCCPIPCISSHIQVVPTPSKYQDRIHLKCTWLCYVRYLSGRRWRWVNPRNRGVFDVKLSVHLSSGLRGAATANHREDMSSFCRLWRVWLTSGLCRWRWLYSLYIHCTLSLLPAHSHTQRFFDIQESSDSSLSWWDDDMTLLRDGSSDSL